MASPKQRCPNCASLSFKAIKSAPTELGYHELENARVSYWRCSVCGCYAQLLTPKSELHIIKKGEVTEDMICKVLAKLGISKDFINSKGAEK